MHISLSIGGYIARVRERERARERESTYKWYYLHNMISAYFPSIGDYIYIERERQGERWRDTHTQRERGEIVKTQKW